MTKKESTESKDKRILQHPEKATHKDLISFVKDLRKGHIVIERAPDNLKDLTKEEIIQLYRIDHQVMEAQKIIIMRAYSDLDDFLSTLEDLEPDEDDIPKFKSQKKSSVGYS